MAATFDDPVGDAASLDEPDAARSALTTFLGECGSKMEAAVRADALLKRFGTLAAVLGACPEALASVDVVDRPTIRALTAANVMLLSALEQPLRYGPEFASGENLHAYLRLRLSHEKREMVRVLHLDAKLRLLADDLLAVGSICSATVPCRELVRRALELGSAAVILVHNHPSGDCRPSKGDIELTRRLVGITRELDLRLQDHLIVGARTITSLRAEGLI